MCFASVTVQHGHVALLAGMQGGSSFPRFHYTAGLLLVKMQEWAVIMKRPHQALSLQSYSAHFCHREAGDN